MRLNKLELRWIGKGENVKTEPRILIENKILSNTTNDKNTENVLIHGDNLLALKALESKYTGQVKCIYIDPPYNTGNAFEHYDDGVEHSIWLNLMSKRLIILEKLLAQDGVIVVQLDKNEMAYGKVIMDEIFGRNNCITTVVVRMSATSGFKIEHSDKTIVKNVEFLHIYSKSLRLKPAYEKTDYDPHYSYILGKNTNGIYEMNQLVQEPLVLQELEKYGLRKSAASLKQLYLISEVFKKFVSKNRNIIGRTHTAPSAALKDSERLMNILPNRSSVVEFFDTKGERYYIKKTTNTLNQFIPISLKFQIVDSYEGISEELSNILGDWWDGFYLDMGNVENEGNVKFKASKKPERLIYRILNMFTNPGDLVLDSFLGSGTTSAVAHKMNRRWIGIEMGEHAYTHCKQRMDSVIDGEQGGISKLLEWKGGGGYKFFELAPTLIKKDQFGQQIINKEYNPDMLASTIALHEGFKYLPSQELFWKQSYSSEVSFLFVTTKHISEEYLELIFNQMGEDEFLLISCKSFDGGLDKKYKNITIKKIPKSILENCEYDVDNYNLNIITPSDFTDSIDEEEYQ